MSVTYSNWMKEKGSSVNSTWLELFNYINQNGYDRSTSTTDLNEIKELNGTDAIIDLHYPLLTLKYRQPYFRGIFGAAYWILSGDDKANTITKYIKNYSSLANEQTGKLDGAYGPPFREGAEFVVHELLKNDQSTRAVIDISHNPAKDEFNTKDKPCTLGMNFRIFENKLHAAVTMRSNDVYMGFPEDVFAFSMMAYWVYLGLKESGYNKPLELGNLRLSTMSSTRIYLRDYDAADLAYKKSTTTEPRGYLERLSFSGRNDYNNELIRSEKEICHPYLPLNPNILGTREALLNRLKELAEAKPENITKIGFLDEASMMRNDKTVYNPVAKEAAGKFSTAAHSKYKL